MILLIGTEQYFGFSTLEQAKRHYALLKSKTAYPELFPKTATVITSEGIKKVFQGSHNPAVSTKSKLIAEQ